MEAKKKVITMLVAFILMATTIVLIKVSDEPYQPSIRYTIQAGDTCATIASSLGVSVIGMIKANNLQMDCSDIYTGQLLSIPQPTLTGLSATEKPSIIAECERAIHRVIESDTLASISNRYEIPEEAISSFNGLEGDKVELGTEIIIPLCDATPSP